MSLYILLFAGTTPIGSFLLGNVAERLGVQKAIVLFGAISVLGVIVALLYRASRKPAGQALPETSSSVP
jgi:predicted MFS family arabinose efflux permease